MVLKKLIVFITLTVVFGRNASGPIKTSSIIGGYACSSRKPQISKYMISLTSFWGYPVCAGTLITSIFVLTASHCCNVYSLLYASNAHDRDKYIQDNGLLAWSCPVVKVERKFQHPNFHSKTLLNDVALMKLVSSIAGPFAKLPVIKDNFASLIFLTKEQFEEELEKDDMFKLCPEATVVGWGTTSKEDYKVVPKELMCVELGVIPHFICRIALRKFVGEIKENNLCAGGSTNKDSCVGDSGGPLLCGDIQYGITSWGPGCALGLPAVYTRVDKFLYFINHTIAKNKDKTIIYCKFKLVLGLFICRIFSQLVFGC